MKTSGTGARRLPFFASGPELLRMPPSVRPLRMPPVRPHNILVHTVLYMYSSDQLAFTSADASLLEPRDQTDGRTDRAERSTREATRHVPLAEVTARALVQFSFAKRDATLTDTLYAVFDLRPLIW